MVNGYGNTAGLARTSQRPLRLSVERHLRGLGIAGLALAAGIVSATAQDMKSPRLSITRVEWNAVAAELDAIDALKSAAAPTIAEAGRTRAHDLIAQLNRATGERFAGIATSPVPVLLPFETTAFLRDRASAADAAAANPPAGNYLSGFSAVPFFYPGPGGYDAVVVARAQEMRELGIGYPEPIYVHISGSALVYDLDEPAGMIGWPVNGGLDVDFPGLRRLFLENYVRYTFVRYGVPYAIAIECFDGGARFRKISCREADIVAVRLLKALRVAGGAPQGELASTSFTPSTIERPAARSTVFTYHSPGDLLPGTGFRGARGVPDYTVYSKIRFPLRDAPAFANSQAFMNWGSCESTGRLAAGMRGSAAAYRCRVNGTQLIWDEAAPENYSYPWRDNFCEHRFFYVGRCPGGLGHQGQDIRPASCRRLPGASRCEPYHHDVVAVRDGAVLRAPRQEALYIVVNAPNERVRFRYLHMQPQQIDADGLVSGRLVREGEVIGKVGNYARGEGATTYHLHFDVQVPTSNGWVFVNPYMTLVAAYERLIRGRGQEIKPEAATAAAPAEPAPGAPAVPALAAKPTETTIESAPQTIDSGIGRDERVDETPAVTASVPADHGGHVGEPGHDGAGAGEPTGVRAMGRGLSRAGPRPWNFRRHLHAGDDGDKTRHSGL
jgi:Peptidase family M23